MGELAAFDDIDDGGLNAMERESLGRLVLTCPELREGDKTRAYLEWGKYMVDNLVVSDYTDEEGHNIAAPAEPQNEPLNLPSMPEPTPAPKHRARKQKGFWAPPDK